MFDEAQFKETLGTFARSEYGKQLSELSSEELYPVVGKAVMEQAAVNWSATRKAQEKTKQAYYLSAEFLMGRALGNNLLNLGLEGPVGKVLREMGLSLSAIEAAEEDAGLGNGGLGRLAACFLDSAATHDLPLQGYGIRYEYGIFKQAFVNDCQVEAADNWLKRGDPWSVRRYGEAVPVTFADTTVLAVPYDTPVIGYGTTTVNTLRLWRAEPLESFDFSRFNSQDYDQAVWEKNRAEDISRVLYPNDSRIEGKILRLKQQYFFVSASLQDLVRKYKARKKPDWSKFAEFHAIQLNDTHPAVAVAELMRLLTTEAGLSWDAAWNIGVATLAYTNHTIMAEALEQWDQELYRSVLPEIVTLIEKIDVQLRADLKKKKVPAKQQTPYHIIENGRIHMANLAIYGTHATNGVAALHTDLLKSRELHHWHTLYPTRFQNKTNGITQRRWLALSNPELSALITELLGSNRWIKELDDLKGLEKFADDKPVLDRFIAIKKLKKQQLCAFIYQKEGIRLNPDALFDIQIKRLHEYKRQLLNALHIVDLYYRIKENPTVPVVPHTFIFGAKAAPGYDRAKAIIRYINQIARLVAADPDMKGKLQVHFVENYNVSYGELLFPAADLSEQISAAGTEASGTGNMKFMLNGTPTLGTYDGANVEIVENAGFENNLIFGARVEDLEAIKDSYDPKVLYRNVPGLKRALDTLIDITFDDGETGQFRELYQAILKGASWHKPDHYFILQDFAAYRQAHDEASVLWEDTYGWARKCWLNLANAGAFSSDRTIRQYADEIWGLKPVKIKK